jgi:hypothetical protein
VACVAAGKRAALSAMLLGTEGVYAVVFEDAIDLVAICD